MRYFLYAIALAILCVPRWATANDQAPKTVRTTTSLKTVNLKALMLPAVTARTLKNELASPPPQWTEEKERSRPYVHDADFFRRAQSRYIYGE